jgi:hypothetical protein
VTIKLGLKPSLGHETGIWGIHRDAHGDGERDGGSGDNSMPNTGVTTSASAIFQVHDTSREWKMFYFNIRMLRCGGGEVKEGEGEGVEGVRTRG